MLLMGTLVRESLSSHHPCVKDLENLALVWTAPPPPRETPLRPISRKIESVSAVGVLHIHLEAKLLSEYHKRVCPLPVVKQLKTPSVFLLVYLLGFFDFLLG